MLRILKITRLPAGLQPLNTLRAYSTLNTEIPDKNEYIPGVQGYAPGFGPPPRKPLTERKLRKKNAHLKKKMSFVNPKVEAPQEAAEKTIETKKEVVPETLAESISIIKQNIDVAGMTYKNKVHLIRHQYTLEMQQLKKKQAEKAEKEAAEAREKQPHGGEGKGSPCQSFARFTYQ
ncbi:hypothetical protein DSO57_1034329 [Entomophthora muscae]|uniref:Uncharacterized protein n=1 Tax=Entomophthora muscae TaxID=34485 RepID=A0ACC2S221_9FUNG|nr:hypothetical protein DSO57_1034329 [Entomophthora muscae]